MSMGVVVCRDYYHLSNFHFPCKHLIFFLCVMKTLFYVCDPTKNYSWFKKIDYLIINVLF
jgi:hypothetical protein